MHEAAALGVWRNRKKRIEQRLRAFGLSIGQSHGPPQAISTSSSEFGPVITPSTGKEISDEFALVYLVMRERQLRCPPNF